MKTMKKAVAAAMAIGLAVTGSSTSFAETTVADETKVLYEEYTGSSALSDGGSADSVITGHIKVTNISVKVPVTSSFDIDPNKEVAAGGAGDAQMGGQAGNYTITNLSTVPLDISITKVAPGNGIGLVTTVAALDTKDKNILFAVREANEAVPALPGGGDDAKWMDSTAITASAPYKVAADDAKNTIEAKGAADGADALTMKVYAATKKGWKAGDSFTVTPTFTVSLHTDPAPDPAPAP